MIESVEIKRLAFERGAGATEWYSADAPCGGAYLIAKSGGGWQVSFPRGCDLPKRFDEAQDAADACQRHLNAQISRFIVGPAESKRCKLGGFATRPPPEASIAPTGGLPIQSVDIKLIKERLSGQ